MTKMLEAYAVLISAGSVLLMAIVLLRWTASFEARLKRIDKLSGFVGSGDSTNNHANLD